MSSSFESRTMPRWWAWIVVSAIIMLFQFGQQAYTHLTQTPEQRRAELAQEKRAQKAQEEMLQLVKDTKQSYEAVGGTP